MQVTGQQPLSLNTVQDLSLGTVPPTVGRDFPLQLMEANLPQACPEAQVLVDSVSLTTGTTLIARSMRAAGTEAPSLLCQ